MRATSTIGLVLAAAAAIATGCGAANGETDMAVEADDDMVARLPPGERSALVERERSVRVAESNVEAARVARQDADRFSEIAEGELSKIGNSAPSQLNLMKLHVVIRCSSKNCCSVRVSTVSLWLESWLTIECPQLPES